MAIDFNRITRTYFLVCDECGEPSVDTYDSFFDARRGAVALGYDNRYEKNGEWVNVCPACKDTDH